MLNRLMNWLSGSTVSAVAEGAAKIGGIFRPNAEAESARFHAADLEVLKQFAAEFREQAGRTRWDSFVDGVNRLPRPLITLGVLGLFVFAPLDPVRFLQVADAYARMPGGYWALLSIIVAFYFGSRHLLTREDFALKGGALVAAKDLVEQRKDFRQLVQEDDDGLPDRTTADAMPGGIATTPLVGQPGATTANRVIATWHTLGRPAA